MGPGSAQGNSATGREVPRSECTSVSPGTRCQWPVTLLVCLSQATVQPPKRCAWCGGSAVRAGLLLADGLSHSWCVSPLLCARSRDQHQLWGLSLVAFLFCISWLLEPALAVLELAS